MTTHRLLQNFLVCVPESQAADYETVAPGHVVTHPDSVRGLTPKLNWMFDHLADDEGIVFLDDDLEYICRCFTDPTEAAARKVTDPATIEAVIAQTLSIAAGVGAFRHHVCLRDTRYAFCQRATFTGAGGQSFYRNSETERRDVALLREKYGDVISVGKQGGTRKRDYAGAVKVTLSLPF